MKPKYSPIYIPSLDELNACVVPRKYTPIGDSEKSSSKDDSKGISLSRESYAFLQSATTLGREDFMLSEHFGVIKVSSGSVQKRVLAELTGLGFIRIERKGKFARVFVHARGWAFLGIEPPSGGGRGGTTHKVKVDEYKSFFKKRGYDVYVEHEIGKSRKRIDLIAYGKLTIGVEIGLSSVSQEKKNIIEDLEAGILDHLIFLTTSRRMLHSLKRIAGKDDYLKKHLSKIHFYLIQE